jgi:hypothetical protein
VEETLETLRLLFPSNQLKTKIWLQGLDMVDRGLHNVGNIKPKDATRHLDHFKYWGERLRALQENVELCTHGRFEVVKALRNREDQTG